VSKVTLPPTGLTLPENISDKIIEMLKIEHDLNFKVSLGLEPLKNILVVLMILGAGAACGSKTNASAGAASILMSPISFLGISLIDQVRNNSVRLNWVGSPQAAAYLIYDTTGGTSAYINTATATTTNYTVSSLSLGRAYRYRVKMIDQQGLISANSNDTAVTTTSAYYANTILADSPANYWRVDEASGTTLADQVGINAGTLFGTYILGTAGAIFGDADTALSFSGAGYFSTSSTLSAPSAFSQELWFKTTTTLGGKLIGFGNIQSGASGGYDRNVYMTNDGRITFGVFSGSIISLTSANPYNDGAWHHLVSLLSGAGMFLYIDGVQVNFNANTGAQVMNGFWRIGYDSLNGWPGTITSYYFTGALDEVAIYNYALSPAQISNHYHLGSGN